MRAVSTVLSALILVGALAFASAIVFMVVPRFFSSYASAAAEAAALPGIPGYKTSAALARQGPAPAYTFYVFIYNRDPLAATVNYRVECAQTRYTNIPTVITVASEQNVFIQANTLYTRVFTYSSYQLASLVCYIVVEEQGSGLIYRVHEG